MSKRVSKAKMKMLDDLNNQLLDAWRVAYAIRATPPRDKIIMDKVIRLTAAAHRELLHQARDIRP